MVSSVLSPEKVVGRQNTNKEAAQNFISGGSVLGSSIVKNAANKIVGFQRAGVQPAPSSVGSIVSAISTNINNNVTNTVNKTLQGFSGDYQRRVKEFNINKITTNITNTVNKTIQGFSADYQRRVKEFNINKITTNITNTVNKTLQGFSGDYQRRVKEFDINKITTNINNNVTNTVNKTLQGFSGDYQRRVKEFDINKITTNITNTVNKTLQGFSGDYQRRVKQVDDSKPLGILGKFLNVYKTALGFINFFGNKKNIDKVRDNLEALKKSFTESFEVAKLIRQVIIKIVKQLSNLPVASPSGGGGLNLDVDIPGGPLRKTAPRNVNRMRGGGGKMLALGAGALGLGALGAGTVNALSDSPQDQAQAAQTTPDIPGDVVDKFSSIVDRFANVISKLFNMKNEKSKGSSGSAGGGGRSGSPGSPGSPPPGGSMGAMEPIASGSADEKLAAYASALEGTSGQNAADAMQVMLNRSAQNHSGYGGLGEQVMARAQFTPMSSAIYGPTGHDPAADAAYGHIAPMLGKTPEERKAKIRQIVETEGFEGLDKLFKKKHAGNANEILADFKSGGPMSQAAVQGVQGRVYFKGQTHLPKKGTGDFYRGTGGNFFHGSSSGKIGTLQPAASGVGGIDLPDYMLSPQKREELKLSATNVSQPPPSQQQQQPVVMPINLGGGGQQQSGGGSSGGGGGSQGSGPSVPFLPTSNPDNFLVLYSRMVYNIVDG